MHKLIEKPAIVQAAGNKPKIIEEYVGRVNSGTDVVSIARMQSPAGWTEPAQIPEFDEYTVVLKGVLRVESETGFIDVSAGQAIHTPKGSGLGTAPRTMRMPNILLSVCLRFRPIQYTDKSNSY